MVDAAAGCGVGAFDVFGCSLFIKLVSFQVLFVSNIIVFVFVVMVDGASRDEPRCRSIWSPGGRTVGGLVNCCSACKIV